MESQDLQPVGQKCGWPRDPQSVAGGWSKGSLVGDHAL